MSKLVNLELGKDKGTFTITTRNFTFLKNNIILKVSQHPVNGLFTLTSGVSNITVTGNGISDILHTFEGKMKLYIETLYFRKFDNLSYSMKTRLGETKKFLHKVIDIEDYFTYYVEYITTFRRQKGQTEMSKKELNLKNMKFIITPEDYSYLKEDIVFEVVYDPETTFFTVESDSLQMKLSGKDACDLLYIFENKINRYIRVFYFGKDENIFCKMTKEFLHKVIDIEEFFTNHVMDIITSINQ